MTAIRRIVLCALTFLLALSGVTGQKLQGDRRPLTGLNNSNIPTYRSVEAFLQANPRSSLLSAARPVGSARLVPFATASPALPLQSTQQLSPQLKIDRAPNGTVRWLEGQVSPPPSALTLRKQAQTMPQAALAVLKSQATLLKLKNPAEELSLMSSTHDEISFDHVRFQQVYQGIPVWGRDLYVHFNAQGSVYLINGTYEPTPVGVETTPAVTSTEALQHVVSDLKSLGRYQPLTKEASSFLGIEGPSEELVIYTMTDGTFRLAYEVSIHPNLVEWYSYIVDAENGQVLDKIARHCSLLPEKAAHASTTSYEFKFEPPRLSNALAGSFAGASASDLNGVTQSMRVWNNGSGTYYLVWDLSNYNAGQSQLPDNPAGGGLTISANYKDLDQNVQLVHSTSPNNTWSDPAAVSAHYNMKLAYDYYTSKHARKAIDDKDASIISIAHVTQSGQAMDNAYWNGRVMAYGDGATDFKPLAGGLDVSGHEMTHGVIQNTADLVYQGQSGALNESFADVFGVMIDRSNYLIGESIVKTPGKVALRDLSNPKNTQLLSPQPSQMSEFQNLGTNQDNGGVHVNSGIPNKAAYNVINSIGREKAEIIYYRALSKYLTKNSQFGDCRKSVVQAATDLVGQSGITTADVTAVNAAFEAVGITTTTGSSTGSGGNEIPPVTGGKQYITFMTESGQIGLLDMASGLANVFSSSSAVARSATGNHAQLSTGLSGKNIWFINQNRQLAFVDVISGLVSTFFTLKIQQAGDLWNASVSPDENYVTLASAYANDANLYIYDGTQLAQIPLDPESTQSGIKVQTIQYPDVVSWSPNMKKPKIGFDAYNEVDVGTTGKVSYWGIYEIDFAAGKVFNLVGSQPSNISIGNITYSNTNPDLVAFNYVDATGKFDTYVGNFDTGQLKALNIPSFSLNGVAVTDAERPTFSPDDAKLCLSSPKLKALLFYDAASEQLSIAPFQVALYNPRWFIQGGKVPSSVESVEIPTAFRLHDNYPNPFNPSTKIEYEVPLRSHVQLAVYDILGRLVRTLVNSDHSNGRYSVAWDGTNETGHQVASGMYIYRLEAGDRSGNATVLSRKMMFLK
jgi:Zn-dependent metalloprotease